MKQTEVESKWKILNNEVSASKVFMLSFGFMLTSHNFQLAKMNSRNKNATVAIWVEHYKIFLTGYFSLRILNESQMQNWQNLHQICTFGIRVFKVCIQGSIFYLFIFKS